MFKIHGVTLSEMTVAANGRKLASSTDRCPHHHNHAGSTDRCPYSPKTCWFHQPVPVLAKNMLLLLTGARTCQKRAGPTERCPYSQQTYWFHRPVHRQVTYSFQKTIRRTQTNHVHESVLNVRGTLVGRSHKYSIAIASYSYL